MKKAGHERALMQAGTEGCDTPRTGLSPPAGPRSAPLDDFTVCKYHLWQYFAAVLMLKFRLIEPTGRRLHTLIG